MDRNAWATAMTKCVQSEAELQNARINLNLNHVLALEDDAEQVKVRHRQDQWIADRTCASEKGHDDSLIGNLVMAVCVIDQDATRADRLARTGAALAKKQTEQH
jgi:hypothetical protein